MKWKFGVALLFSSLLLSGCSVFGVSGVDEAPYKLLKKDDNFEVRHYERLVLVTTPSEGMGEQRKPFGRLFDYISGNNQQQQKIDMTAPVFMDQENGESTSMSFVMPFTFTQSSTPKPEDPSVMVHSLEDYTVASVTFSGFLDTDNIREHEKLLRTWIDQHKLVVKGLAKAAGYNPPFTIPALRRNEVLIPVER